MSELTLVEFSDGTYKETVYKNSWGGASYIWQHVYEKYIDQNGVWLSGFLNPTISDRFWQIPEQEDVPYFIRLTLLSTADGALVKSETFNNLANAFREFVQYFGTQNGVCHLLQIADKIKKSNAQHIAFFWRFESRPTWFVADENDKENKRMFDPLLDMENETFFHISDYVTMGDQQ